MRRIRNRWVSIKYKTLIGRILVVLAVAGLFAINMSCARKGLVSENYPIEFYRVPKLLSDERIENDPKFIVYGDNRPDWRVQEKFLKKENWLTWRVLLAPYWLGNGIVGGINWLRHTPDYGRRERRMVRDSIYAEAKRSEVNFILNTGDMPYNGQRPSHWETFLKENRVERPLLLEFPYIPVVGNHERVNDSKYGLPNYQAIFPYPQFHVLDFPDAALFVVDSNLIIDQYEFVDDDEQNRLFEKWFVSDDSAQPAWLERELASRNKTFKMVAMHHPPISFGKHHGDWSKISFGRNLNDKRQQLLELFIKHEVQVVFCGHEHLYEHNTLQYSSDGDKRQREIHFIVSGGGGVPLQDVKDAQTLERFRQNYRDVGLDVLSVKQENVFHYCLVNIDSDQIRIEVFEVTGNSAQPVKLMDKIHIPK